MEKKPACILDLEKALGLEMTQVPFGELWDIQPGSAVFSMNKDEVVDGLCIDHMSGISEHLPRFPNLHCLISRRSNVMDLSHLAFLTALTQLNLSNNQIQDLAHLAPLTALTRLSLGNNKIQNISHLSSLTALTQLNLSNNQVEDISHLSSLTALTHLALSNNKVQDLLNLTSLTNLAELYLYNTQVQDIAPLASLTALERLNLRNNQIQDISHLASLTALTHLRLDSNEIQDLAPLKELARTVCPFVMSDGYVKNGITITDNPLQRPPLEIARRGHQAIMAWFDAQRETQHPLNEVKVLLVGAGGAGKTSLVRALMGQDHDPHEPTTHGIRIEHWMCPGDQGEVQVHFWDFGGQEIMHATHQFFMSERCLYILVLDGRKEEAREEHWLKLIESFGGDSKVLVVINKIDENPGFELNRRGLLEKFPHILGFHRISCSKGTGVEDFRRALTQALKHVELIKSIWPEPWFKVKSHLETCQMDFISYQEYQGICRLHQVTALNQQKTLLTYLHDLGISLHFDDLEWLNTQVLNPVSITNPIYALINHPELANQQGIVGLKQLPALLPSFPQDRLPYLLKLMQKFELCYELDDKLLVTDLLPVAQPVLPQLQQPLNFSVRYYFLPSSILQRLMVRRHHEIEKGQQWRTGMVLRHPQLQSRALVTTDAGERRLRLQLDGAQRREFLALILDSLHQIHAGYKKIEPEELLRCPCSLCQTSASPAEYDYAQVLLFQVERVPLHCPKSAKAVSIDNLIQQTYIQPKTTAELIEFLRELRQTFKDKSAFLKVARIILEREPGAHATRHGLEAAIEWVWPKKKRHKKVDKPAAFLSVATEWDSGKGGLSTFNRELCIALAAAGHPCFCLVPQYDDTQRQAAAAVGVQLIAPPKQPGLSEEAQLLGKLELPSEHGPYWVIGHDRITGPQAAARVAQGGYAGLILFVHTIPDEIEWFKHENDRDPARSAEDRSDLQLELARQAKLVVAVGPRIHEHLDWLCKGANVKTPLLRLDPGLAPFDPPGPPTQKRSCLLLGRAEDAELKGLDIAARALGQLDHPKLTLVIRGAAPGTSRQLKTTLEQQAGNPNLAIQPQEYSSQREKIAADLRRATLLLMPSRVEGFGLVGLEAIAAGIPVLISANSGLAELLQELVPDNKAVIAITGDAEKDRKAWARRIDFILEDPEAAFQRAQKLYDQLSSQLTWPRAIKKLVSHIPQPPGA